MTSVRVSHVRPGAGASPPQFNAVKVFSATMHRNALGDAVTKWLEEHPAFRVSDIVVTQSSDAAFHCVSICLFYLDGSHPSNHRRGMR
jgi:hypothetical protein